MTDIDPTLHPGHKDAGKDPAFVVATFQAYTRQEMDILHNLGAHKATILRTEAIIQNALLMAVETVVRERRDR